MKKIVVKLEGSWLVTTNSAVMKCLSLISEQER